MTNRELFTDDGLDLWLWITNLVDNYVSDVRIRKLLTFRKVERPNAVLRIHMNTIDRFQFRESIMESRTEIGTMETTMIDLDSNSILRICGKGSKRNQTH